MTKIVSSQAVDTRSLFGVRYGVDFSVIPFGGSMGETDLLEGKSLQRQVVGPYLVENVQACYTGGSLIGYQA